MVRRIRWGRMLLVIFLMAFAVFFGLDLATRGMERVQGPAADAGKPAAVAHQPETKAAAGAKAGATAAAGGGSAGGTKGTAASSTASAATSATGGTKSAATAKTSASGTTAQAAASGQTAVSSNEPKFEMKKSFMNQLSNRIGDALRRAARAIIGLVVSVFGSLIK